jgi:hypothetical protein
MRRRVLISFFLFNTRPVDDNFHRCSKMKSRPTVALKLIPHLILIKIALGISSCPQDLGGGVCPDNSKCCKIHSATGQTTSGCLPHNNHLKGPGTCCHDTAFFGGGTACPGNYQCGYSVKSGTNSTICFLPDSQGNVIEEMPRYNIAEAVPREIGDYYGFPISYQMKRQYLRIIPTWDRYLHRNRL